MVRRCAYLSVTLSCMTGLFSLAFSLPARAQAIPFAEERFCSLPLLLSGEEQQEAGAAGGKQKKSPGKEQNGKDEKDKGEDEKNRKPARYLAIGQATWILQRLFPFHSPYGGEESLRAKGETQFLHTYTGFFGARIGKDVEIFVNPELALGRPISSDGGTSGSLDGEALGQGELPDRPYLARYFVRWRIPIGSRTDGKEMRIGRSENIIPQDIPVRRVVITFGKIEYADVFDANLYANDSRTQFLNDALNNNAAYDAGQDLRGYTGGLTVAWTAPDFGVRVGVLQMPTAPGENHLSWDFSHNRCDQLELDLYPRLLGKDRPMSLRLLTYRNRAERGRYSDALAAASDGEAPDVTEVRRRGAGKFGYGLNLEQPLADGGKTGLFSRYGWNNGTTETVAFADVDCTFSLGGQVSGVHWRREDDRVGLAVVQNDLSAVHRAYLAAGGSDTSLGDGALHYGAEQIVEAYYSYQIREPLALSLDMESIGRPGYNRDRGPAFVIAMRLHAEF